MGALSPTHLVIILLIALIVVGPGKLPEVGAAIGKSVREFRNATGGLTDLLTGTLVQPAQPPQPAPTPQAAPPPQAGPAQPPQTGSMTVPQPDAAVAQPPSAPKVD